MHPTIRESRPMLCPECGMQLVPVKGVGMEKHEGHSPNLLARKFWVCLVLTIPVLVYSELFTIVTGTVAPPFPGSGAIPALLGSAVFFYGGWLFIAGAFRELRARVPGMMTLIGLAISVAYAYSIYAVFAPGVNGLFWELTTLITVMLLGHWLEMRAVQGSQRALKELAKLLPDTAELLKNGRTLTVPIGELKVGDLVLVKPGARVPADGVVVEGVSEVNESLVTGESKPVRKVFKQEVIAGTINGDGSLTVKVARTGEDTFIAGIKRLIADAQASKSRMQTLSDRAAFGLTVIAVVSGTLTFFAWLPTGFGTAVERLVTVLVIACPHALGLAIPLVAVISTTLSARNGVLVRQRLALEAARNVDVVLFDKTGTLTKGEYGVTAILPVKGGKAAEASLLQLAASVERHSEHVVAKALVAEAESREIALKDAKEFKRLPGSGVRGRVGTSEVRVVGESSAERKATLPAAVAEPAAEFAKRGNTVITVIVDKKPAGVIALGDVIRSESHEAVNALKRMGVRVAMLTGDSEDVAKWVAGQLGMNEYFARVHPDEKSAKVAELQRRGFRVAMVGDGVNDAPALTRADVGIAIGAGTNVAIESAGIILVRNDPRDVVKVIRLSRATYAKMIQNLFWATAYNIAAIPLAAGVLASQGVVLQPAVGALFMSLSTVIVAVNASFLWRARL